MVTRRSVSRRPKIKPRTKGTSKRNPVAMTSKSIHQGDHSTVVDRVQSASSPHRAHTGGIHPASTSCKCRSIDAMAPLRVVRGPWSVVRSQRQEETWFIVLDHGLLTTDHGPRMEPDRVQTRPMG